MSILTPSSSPRVIQDAILRGEPPAAGKLTLAPISAATRPHPDVTKPGRLSSEPCNHHKLARLPCLPYHYKFLQLYHFYCAYQLRWEYPSIILNVPSSLRSQPWHVLTHTILTSMFKFFMLLRKT